MRPKKARELSGQVAAELNLPLKVVEDIVNFYWKEVWNALTDPKNIKVHITNLGDFNIKHWLLEKERTKLEIYLNTCTDNKKLKENQKFRIQEKTQQKLSTICQLQQMVQDELQRKEFIYEHKKNRNESTEEEFDSDLEG